MTRARVILFLLLGPAAWAADLEASYVVVPHLASGNSRQWLLAITAAAACASLLGAALAHRTQRRGSDARPAWRFVARSSALLNVFFVLVILATAIPKVLLEPGN